MIIRLAELQEIIAQAVDAGIQEYKRGIEPDGDMVRRAQVISYLKRHGHQPVILERWVADGLIKERKGNGQNSPCKYSLSAVKKLLLAINIKQLSK